MQQEPIRDAVRRTTQQTLRHDRAVPTLARLLTQLFDHTTTAVERLAEQTRLACTAGCAFCCYHPVDITPPEAFAIVAYLQMTLPAAAREVTYGLIAAQAERLHGLSYEEHAQQRLPCALLVDGQCTVYPCRPFACRAWNSTSAARCETIFTHGNPITMLPPLDMPTYETVWDAAHGMMEGLQQCRLDAKAYELHSIVQRVWDTPEAAHRWTQGEPVFAGCVVGAFTP